MAGLRYLVVATAMLGMAPAAQAAERGFTVTDFDRIRVEGPFAVEVTTGRGTAASASGAREALDRIVLNVQGRTLTIRANRGVWGGYPGEDRASGPVLIRISTGELRSVMLAGSGSIRLDRARGPRLELIAQGSGRLEIARVETDRLDIGMVGSASARLAGNVRALKATVSGSSALDGAGLTANDLILNTQSAGDVTLGAKTSARVHASGAGSTTILGKPACTVTATGAGTVACGR